jgi:transcriptional regulator with XRE-family HTH domain
MAVSLPEHAGAIGSKLRAVRREQQMSLRKLAVKADISASMLSQIETGKAYPSVRSLYNIAAALAVPVDYFFPDPGANERDEDLSQEATAPETLTASEMREARLGGALRGMAAESGAAPGAPPPVVHRAARPTIELKGGVTWARLTARSEPGVEFLEITYAPGASSGATMSHHAGREFGLVLSGELTVELGFEVYTLAQGDTVIFDSATPHRLSNNGAEPVRAVWVVLSNA